MFLGKRSTSDARTIDPDGYWHACSKRISAAKSRREHNDSLPLRFSTLAEDESSLLLPSVFRSRKGRPIYKMGRSETLSGASSPERPPSIPNLQINIPSFRSKSAHPSVNLPRTQRI